MQGQVYLADALEEFSTVPGRGRWIQRVRTQRPKQTTDPPDPPESYRIVFEVVGTCPGVE